MTCIKHNQLVKTAIVLGSLALAACDSDTKTKTTVLDWKDCSTGTLQCVDLSVPMDYNAPEGEKIEVALVRHLATGTDRKGSLMFNPGGPGGSGIELVNEFIEIEALPESILASYDIIGFDPRSIGDSTPVDCNEFGLEEINEYPLTSDDINEMYNDYTDFAVSCSEKYGDYLQHLGSLNVTRDMEEIRKALGDDEVNFIGYSYGTRLAALYLQTFPTTSGRIVLDGSLLPDSQMRPLVDGQLDQMQISIKAVLSRCTSVDPNCNIEDLLNKLVTRVNYLVASESESALEEIDLVGQLIIEATEDPEFASFAAIPLINYINSEDLSSFTDLLMFLDQNEDDSEEDEEEREENGDSDTAQIAVICADDATRADADTLINALGQYNQRSDLFAELQIGQLAICSGWPASIDSLPTIASDTAPVSLVIGGTTDAQTPLSWSESMASSIGGLFIRSEHLGHTSVFNDESDCIDNMVEKFLIDGTLPSNTECTAE